MRKVRNVAVRFVKDRNVRGATGRIKLIDSGRCTAGKQQYPASPGPPPISLQRWRSHGRRGAGGEGRGALGQQ